MTKSKKRRVANWRSAQELQPDALEPERKLLVEVLRGAIRDATAVADPRNNTSGYQNKVRRIRNDALTWFMSDIRYGGHYFTFLFVCDVLGLDAGLIREQVVSRGDALRERMNYKLGGCGVNF